MKIWLIIGENEWNRSKRTTAKTATSQIQIKHLQIAHPISNSNFKTKMFIHYPWRVRLIKFKFKKPKNQNKQTISPPEATTRGPPLENDNNNQKFDWNESKWRNLLHEICENDRQRALVEATATLTTKKLDWNESKWPNWSSKIDNFLKYIRKWAVEATARWHWGERTGLVCGGCRWWR